MRKLLTASYLWRIVLTIFSILAYGWINALIRPVAVLASADVAGKQFESSNWDYLTSSFSIRFFDNIGLPFFGLLLVLAVIWIPLLRHRGKNLVAVSIFAVAALCAPQKVQAYFDTTDKTEAYTILPNESAFWIPDVGDNKTTQGQFDSEAYLQQNKLGVKRFIIPHHKLTNSGGNWGVDAYVPDGRLIIVDRTTYSKEWVAAQNRGTSASDQSFPCQSKEGLNITVGVSIAASVAESNAAKFLYHFGVQSPRGNRNDPQVIFTSVYSGRSLSDVMDDVGRKKVQTLVCTEISSRDFDHANSEANAIMEAVRKSTADYFSSIGITLDFIGWADTFRFDDAVQKAVNDRFIAQTVASSIPTLQALADIRIKEGLGDGLRAKGLPSNLIAVPDHLLGNLSSMFGGKISAGATEGK